MNHYDTLGVPKNASPEDIQRAYRRKSRAAHPDRGGSHQAMVAVNGAFETLTDPEKRARYDETGEDGNPKPGLDDRARTILMQLFAQCVDALPDTADAVAVIRESISAAQAKAVEVRRKTTAQIEKMEKKRKRIKYRGKGRNFLDDLLEHRIRDLRAKITALDEAEKEQVRALELLTEYAWDAEPAVIVKFETATVIMTDGTQL